MQAPKLTSSVSHKKKQIRIDTLNKRHAFSRGPKVEPSGDDVSYPSPGKVPLDLAKMRFVGQRTRLNADEETQQVKTAREVKAYPAQHTLSSSSRNPQMAVTHSFPFMKPAAKNTIDETTEDGGIDFDLHVDDSELYDQVNDEPSKVKRLKAAKKVTKAVSTKAHEYVKRLVDSKIDLKQVDDKQKVIMSNGFAKNVTDLPFSSLQTSTPKELMHDKVTSVNELQYYDTTS